uniref:Protein transport protein sec16 n=1 Tax=Caenorhabditis tropicalis TaxID=1561998 RepID=A0A1I7TDV3_9PELO
MSLVGDADLTGPLNPKPNARSGFFGMKHWRRRREKRDDRRERVSTAGDNEWDFEPEGGVATISSLFGNAIGCLPGLGLGGGGGGGCCSPAAGCGNPCGGGGGAAPAPVNAAAPLAPAPFAAYPQAPAASFQPAPFQQQQFGGANSFQPQQQFQQVQGGYAGAQQGGNYGSIQTGSVSAGGAYLAEPVQQVQPLPLLGQPVAYQKTVAVAPTQQQEQVLNTAQVLTKVMPASAVLDENVVEPAVASPNNIVTSVNTQTGYGDEQQTQTQTHQVQEQQRVLNRPAVSSSSSSSSSSASSSAEHHATHQVRVPSSFSSIESNEQRVVPESIIVKEIVQSFETTTPFPKQVALNTIAPFAPQPVQPVPKPIQTIQPQVYQPQPVPQQIHYPAPQVPSVPQTVVETIQPVVHPIQPAPVQPAPLPTAHNVQVSVPEATQSTSHFVPETKVVAEEDRIEATGGSDYDQPSVPSNIPSNEQATVNELLASLDTATATPTNNLDLHQVTVEPNPNQKPAIIQTEGDDYDVPLNEDRKDVPTAEPSHNIAPSNPEPVAVVPEETAPIIPQPIQQIQPVQTYQPQVTSAPVAETTVGYVEAPKPLPQVHLQPVAPAVRVEVTTSEPTPTIAFEIPIEVHEVVTPQVPLQPEPAVIQTITEEPIAEVTVQVLPTSAAPVSQFFENITSREENKEESAAPTQVQGAETKQVSEPIQIETIENENPYGRRYWIF